MSLGVSELSLYAPPDLLISVYNLAATAVSCFCVAFIPLWILPSTFGGLSAGAFCIQIGVQGAWGVVSSLVSITSEKEFIQ